MSRIASMLEQHRARLVRPGPQEAWDAIQAGALLVDIRPEWQRREYGEVPGAIVIERNHLEWRVDPTSPNRLEPFDRDDLHIIVMCQEGYSSSLAATSLQDVGLVHATDLDGGFEAWQAAGLPTRT